MWDAAQPFGNDEIQLHPCKVRTQAAVYATAKAPVLVHLAVHHQLIA